MILKEIVLLSLYLFTLSCAVDTSEEIASLKRLRDLSGSSAPARPKKLHKVDPSLDTALLEKFAKFDLFREKLRVRDPDVLRASLGHGGTYKSVQPVASSKFVIESDHAPHFSLLSYIDPNTQGLPENLKNILQNRAKLEADLPDKFHTNAKEMRQMRAQMQSLQKKLGRQSTLRVNQWDKSLRDTYNENRDKMTQILESNKKLYEDIKVAPNPAAAAKIQQTLDANNKQVGDLLESNRNLRKQAEDMKGLKRNPKDAMTQNEYDTLKKKYDILETENSIWGKKLASFNDKVKGAMSVLSIPYNVHRNFPTTGFNGLDEDIAKLKKASAGDAKIEMEKRDKAFHQNIDEGIKKKYITGTDVIKNPDGTTNYGATWEKIGQRVSKFGAVQPVPINQRTAAYNKKEYFARLKQTRASQFMATSIYYAKTPSAGYERLMNLYVTEYKIVLPDFDNYKAGLVDWVKTNKDFGWLTTDDAVDKVRSDLDLDDNNNLKRVSPADQQTFKMVQDTIDNKAAKQEKVKGQDKDKSKNIYSPMVCGSGSRRRRSADGKCIISTKNKLDVDNAPEKVGGASGDVDIDKQRKNTRPASVVIDDPDDAMKRPRLSIPSDSDTSIDSKQLSSLLKSKVSNNPGDADFARTREAIVDYAKKNPGKLTGTEGEISEAKALLKRDGLDSSAEKNELAKQAVDATDTGKGSSSSQIKAPPKKPTKFGKMQLSAKKLAGKLSKFSDGSGKVGSAYGKFMLGKTIVTSLRHGDYTGLAIVGGRIGLDYALKGVEKLGKLVARKATTKFGTKLGASILGKAAGPIGAIADIGLNVWSITRSAKVLNDPNASKYDRNDAIADIVADSIDIAVTAAAAVLSLVFPPLAPVFGAIAFVVNVVVTLAVGIFKMGNHVNRLNDQIPLLDYEKTNEAIRFISMKEVSGYLKDLIDTKKANNIEVNMTVGFLKGNPDYIGKVAPSRTLIQPDAPCYLQSRTCHKALLLIPAGCDSWRDLVQCSGPGGNCPGYGGGCDYAESGVNPIGFVFYGQNEERKCRCGDEPPTEWGYEIRDSEVDFSRKRDVYLQRSAPDYALESGFSYMCKPSSAYFTGDKVTVRDSTWAYLCKGAYGIQRASRKGKFMLYDLGDGDDKINLAESDSTDNLIIVKKGVKTYLGNRGDDTFYMDGDCSGIHGELDGRGYRDQGNTLLLSAQCSPGNIINVDLNSGYFGVGDLTKSTAIRNFNRLVGRNSSKEIIEASCSTKFIHGGGGGDHITLPRCSYSRSDIVIVAEGRTAVDTTRVNNGKVFIIAQYFDVLEVQVPAELEGETNMVIKLQEPRGSLTSASFLNSMAEFRFGRSAVAKINFAGVGGKKGQAHLCSSSGSSNKPAILLQEVGSTDAKHISVDATAGSMQMIVPITSCHGRSHSNSYKDILSSVYQVQCSGLINLSGGRKDDTFILQSGFIHGTLNGGGGLDTLILPKVNQPVVVNLISGEIRQAVSGHILKVTGIQQIIGNTETKEYILASCQTQLVSVGNGAGTDSVMVSGNCSGDITIQAPNGHVDISVDAESNRNVLIQAGYEKSGGCGPATLSHVLKLSINNLQPSEKTMTVLNFPAKALSSVRLQLDDTTQTLNLTFDRHSVQFTGNLPSLRLQEGEKQSGLEIHEGTLVGTHVLQGGSGSVRFGAKPISNIFHLASGNWDVQGGDQDDTFMLQDATLFSGSIEGTGGTNTLILDESTEGLLQLNLMQSPGYLNNIKISHINTIYGRTGRPDILRCGCACDISLVGLNGGALGAPDEITAVICGQSTTAPITVIAKGHTNLDWKRQGDHQFYIFPDEANQIAVNLNISTLPESNAKYTIPILTPTHNLKSYDFTNSVKESGFKVRVNLQNHSFVELEADDLTQLQEAVNIMFVHSDFSSLGSVIIDPEKKKIFVIHQLQENDGDDKQIRLRQGAVGAQNMFRLEGGVWDMRGGQMDDSFILKGGSGGDIHGYGGVDTLILDGKIVEPITIDLKAGLLEFAETKFTIHSIEILKGASNRQENVTTDCTTRLVITEGGSDTSWDIITVNLFHCYPKMDIFIQNCTQVNNLASNGGNFTYHVYTQDNFLINYDPDEAQHKFNFSLALKSIEEVHLSEALNSSSPQLQLEILFEGSNATQQFPLPVLPENWGNVNFFISESDHLFAEIMTRDGVTLEAEIFAKTGHTGDIHGINGARNTIVIESDQNIGSVAGSELDDHFMLHGVTTSIQEINGGGGTHNRVTLGDRFYAGQEVHLDLNEGTVTIGEDKEIIVEKVLNTQIVTGRESDGDVVTLDCDTKWVTRVEEVIVRNAKCSEGYSVRLEVGEATRVTFWIDDENFEVAEEEEESEEELEEDADMGTSTTTKETFPEVHSPGIFQNVSSHPNPNQSLSLLDLFDDEVLPVINEDDLLPEEDMTTLSTSSFHYHFISVRSFDIEVDSWHRLFKTRHFFYLNWTIADLKSISFSVNSSRLIYTLDQDGGITEYSHFFPTPDDRAIYYTNPELFTADGFLIRISRYGEIFFTFGNLDEELDRESVISQLAPGIAHYSKKLSIPFLIDTQDNFVYSGVPGDISILTSRINSTSHLIGFNQTTYVILSLDKDVYIYPQGMLDETSHNQKQVVDLTEIVPQIRSKSGIKYVPQLEREKENLKLTMSGSGLESEFPASVIIVNGTNFKGVLRVLLGTLAMTINSNEATLTGKRRKRELEEELLEPEIETEWKLTPAPIEIPPGYLYLLSSEDLEDGAVISEKEIDQNQNKSFAFTRDGDDLLVTSMAFANEQTEEEEDEDETTLIISDYFKSRIANNVEESFARNTTLLFNNRTYSLHPGGEITSFSPASGESEKIKPVFYEDLLEEMEVEILADFPEIERNFQVPVMRKIMRSPTYKFLFYAAIAIPVILISLLLIQLLWNLFGRMRKSGNYSVVWAAENCDTIGTGMEMTSEEGTVLSGKILRKLFKGGKVDKRSYHPNKVANAPDQSGEVGGEGGTCLLQLEELRN